MDLRYAPEDLGFRDATRRWLEANVPREEPVTLEARRAWHRQLYDAGYIGMGWPVPYGGRGATPLQQAIAADEMARAGAPAPINPLGIGIVGPTIIVHGTETQKRRYLQKILTAEELWCQLYSEPNAGSDLASLRTRAQDRGDHFVVNGQKIWTSGGLVADWGLLLARTDAAVPKHKGISCFLIAMRQPGVEVRPLRQITGSAHFSEVFMSDARIEKADLVGRLGQGWEIAQTTLSYERGGSSLARVTRYAAAFRQLLRAARTLRRGGRPLLDDPGVRGKLGRIYVDLEVQRYAALRDPLGAREGRVPRSRRVDHEALVQRVREALSRAGPGDPRPLGPGAERPVRRVHGDRHVLGRARHLGDGVPLVPRRDDLRGLLGDPEEHHRRAGARAAEGSSRRSGAVLGGRRGLRPQPGPAAPARHRPRVPRRARDGGRGPRPVGRSARGAGRPLEGAGAARLARSRAAGGSRRERPRHGRDRHRSRGAGAGRIPGAVPRDRRGSLGHPGGRQRGPAGALASGHRRRRREGHRRAPRRRAGLASGGDGDATPCPIPTGCGSPA